MKQRNGPCSVYPSPKGERKTLARSKTHVKIAESQLQLKEESFGLSRQPHCGSRLGRKWARGFSKHRESCPNI